MEKIIRKIFEDSNFIKGYAFLVTPMELSEEGLLDTICDIMKEYPNHRYIKHFVSEEFVEDQKLGTYNVGDLKIPRGIQSYYLHLFISPK